jgi:hypothetical protein
MVLQAAKLMRAFLGEGGCKAEMVTAVRECIGAWQAHYLRLIEPLVVRRLQMQILSVPCVKALMPGPCVKALLPAVAETTRIERLDVLFQETPVEKTEEKPHSADYWPAPMEPPGDEDGRRQLLARFHRDCRQLGYKVTHTGIALLDRRKGDGKHIRVAVSRWVKTGKGGGIYAVLRLGPQAVIKLLKDSKIQRHRDQLKQLKNAMTEV